MKKIFAFVFVSLFLFPILCFAGFVSKTVSSADEWTDPIAPLYGGKSGYVNVSISGTLAGTVTLQRRFSGGSWMDVKTWLANTEKALQDFEPAVQYRIGIKTSEYTSGAAVVRLSN